MRRSSQTERELLYKEMLAEGVEPDDHVFNVMMSRCSTVDAAFHWLTEMEQRGRIPTVFHFAPLCKLCDKSSWPRITEAMTRHKVTFDERCAVALLTNHRVTLSEGEMEQVLLDVKGDLGWLSPRFCGTWLRRLGSFERAVARAQDFADEGIERDENIIAALCAIAPTVRQALDLEADFRQENDVISPLIAGGVFDSAIRTRAEFSTVEDVFDRLIAEDAQIPVKKVDHLINGANADQCRKIISAFDDRGIRLTQAIFDIGVSKIMEADPEEGMKLLDAFGFEVGIMLVDKTAERAIFKDALRVVNHSFDFGGTVDEKILTRLSKSARSLDDCLSFLELLRHPANKVRLTNLLIFTAAQQLSFADHLEFFRQILKMGNKITLRNWESLLEKGTERELARLAKKAPNLGVARLAYTYLIDNSPVSETSAPFRDHYEAERTAFTRNLRGLHSAKRRFRRRILVPSKLLAGLQDTLGSRIQRA